MRAGIMEWMLVVCIGMDGIFTVYTQTTLRSWYAAQNFCLSMGKRLDASPPESVTSYWTYRYKRISLWIKILGCYPESFVTDSENILMEIPSVGMCQEICLEENKLTFAVKNSSCVCLESVSSPPPLEAKICNYTCGFDRNSFYECGGPTAYNIYMYMSGTAMENSKGTDLRSKGQACLAIQCSNPLFFYTDCSDSYAKICENKWSKNGYSTSWRTSMNDCKWSSPSSYLRGNVSLENAAQECVRLGMDTGGQTWIGIANQVYKSVDRGNKTDKKLIWKCQRCYTSDGRCYFRDCLASTNFKCVSLRNIKNSTNENIPITKTQSSTMEPYSDSSYVSFKTATHFMIAPTSSNITEFIVKMATNSLNEQETKTSLYIIIPLSVVFLLVVIVVAAVVILRRKKIAKENKNDQTRTSHKGLRENNSKVGEVFDLKAQQRNSNNTLCSEQQRAENPYIEKEEGDYDHLGQSELRKPIPDDTYHHAGFVSDIGFSEYDTSNNINRSDLESTYDYAGQHKTDRRMDYCYGYNLSEKRKITVDESEYSKINVNLSESSM